MRPGKELFLKLHFIYTFICVQINGKMCPLPNPIPTNKPNVEPKRPPRLGFLSLRDTIWCTWEWWWNLPKKKCWVFFFRPINITPLCKLSPILANTVNVKWAADYGETSNMWLKEKLDIIFSGKGWVVGIWLVEKLSSEQVIIIYCLVNFLDVAL